MWCIMLSELTLARNVLPRRQIACLSMEFIDAAFSYQREVLEMRHQAEIAVFENPEAIKAKNESLKLKRKENKELIHRFENELKMAQDELADKKGKILELKHIAHAIANGIMSNPPIPRDTLLKCKEELRKRANKDC